MGNTLTQFDKKQKFTSLQSNPPSHDVEELNLKH